MEKIAIILTIFCLIVSSNFQAVSAEIFFPSTNIRLTNPVTYCIITPSNEVSQNNQKNWVRLAEDAISYWEESLKEAELENDSIWEIKSKIISEEKDEECGVYIEFKDQPKISDTIGGYFSWPPGEIVIYYLQPKLCNSVLPCYDDKTMKSDEAIYAITLHEIGHSFGLDHYVSDNNDLNRKWQLGSKNPPSVMIPTIPYIPSILQITDIDIQKVREIYGTQGFYAFSKSIIPIPSETPNPVIPLSPITELNISEQIIEINNYGQEIIKLSGKISEEEFHRGISVIITIHKPDDSVEVLRISTTGNGFFETLLIFDDESIRGNYRISASYLEQVDKNMDITFEVIDKIDSSPQNSIPKTQIFEDSQSQDTTSENQDQIPEWIKTNSQWWASEQIGDHAFVSGLQYLIKENIIQVPEAQDLNSQTVREMPIWIKNIASYWATDIISDDEFIRSIQYLLEKDIIVIQ